jgi:FixJ family two-component response regulator
MTGTMPLASPATVFAVDDDERFLTAIGRVLMIGGYTVEAVASATAFLQRTPSTALGCVLVDLQMPEMTGLEFQERLRAGGWTQPVLFLSGQGTIPATTQALRAGALDFLTKPVRSEDLLKSVAEAVDRHAAILSTNGEREAARRKYDALTPREREVCLGVARGQLNKQIAYDLDLTLATIKFHRARGLIKLGVNSVPELVLLLDRIGVLETPIGPVSQR